MADTGIFATTAEVQRYIPNWANATYNAEAYINQFISFWENYVNNLCGYNWSDNYSSANADAKRLLSLFVVVNVAMDVCSMNISGTDIRTAEFFFDRMTDIANKAEKLIKENEKLNFIKDA